MKNTTQSYGPRVQHSLAFYQNVLLTIIDGLNRKFSDAQIADLLTAKGLLAPSGKTWTAVSVRNALFKIRNHRNQPSRLHQSLLQLAWDGLINPAQAFILFEPRRTM